MLLARSGAPRSVWERQAAAPRSAEIDIVAVAEVLRAHGGDDLRVIRAALDGTEVSAETLEIFIEAFEVGPRQADRLRGLLRGSDAVRVISGDAMADLHRQVGPPQHTTLALHEMHTLGPDGLPAEHQTIQVIQSTVEQ